MPDQGHSSKLEAQTRRFVGESQSQEKLLSCRISERSGSGNEAVMFQQNVRNSGNDAGPVSTGQRQNELVGHVGHLVRNLSEVR